uniref:Uncharacterized protein n=1 Tax=Anguilla anguilla TaxID=7936 RepID=A0A0E9V9E4_ANGAN
MAAMPALSVSGRERETGPSRGLALPFCFFCLSLCSFL